MGFPAADLGLGCKRSQRCECFEKAQGYATAQFGKNHLGDKDGFLITDAAGTDQESARLVTLLAAHNDVLVAFVFDPLEAALPDAGRLVMCEGERQLDVDTSPRSLRDRYRSDFAQRRAAARDLARQRQIPVLPLDTATDVSAQLRELLGRRR